MGLKKVRYASFVESRESYGHGDLYQCQFAISAGVHASIKLCTNREFQALKEKNDVLRNLLK